MRQILIGLSGRLLSGFYPAAEFGRWDISTPDDREELGDGDWRLIGVLTSRDEFWSNQSPFVLEIDSGPELWRWQNVKVEWLGNEIVAHGKGSPEVS